MESIAIDRCHALRGSAIQGIGSANPARIETETAEQHRRAVLSNHDQLLAGGFRRATRFPGTGRHPPASFQPIARLPQFQLVSRVQLRKIRPRYRIEQVENLFNPFNSQVFPANQVSYLVAFL